MAQGAEVYCFYKQTKENFRGLILVTLFSAEGSTYQKAGARILVSPDGKTSGLMSGGCLEAEIIRRALASWQDQEPGQWYINTMADDDRWFGYGLGCKGAMTLVFEPMRFTDPSASSYLELLIVGETYKSEVIHAYSAEQKVVKRAIKNKDGSWHRQEGFPKELISNSMLKGWLVMREVLLPQHKITIFGSGRDVVPLLKLCSSLGWHTTLVLKSVGKSFDEAIPGEIQVEVGYEIAALNCWDSPYQYVVLMTHNFESDYKLLKILSQKMKILYVGALGPQHRREGLLDQLDRDNGSEDYRRLIEPRLYAPVGLPLGGRLPSDIALSIVSEIQAHRFGQQLGRTQIKHQDVSIVILAAGESRRLAGPMKQLLEFMGETLLRGAVSRAKKIANNGVFVVLGHRWQELAGEIDDDVSVLINSRYQEGLSTSIKLGFKAAIGNASNSGHKSVLFLLVDQVLVSEQHLESLIEMGQRTQKDMVASRSLTQDYLGVPALFSGNTWDAIQSLQGVAGCKSVLEAAKQDCAYVDTDEIDFDVDTPEDLLRLQEMDQQNQFH